MVNKRGFGLVEGWERQWMEWRMAEHVESKGK
jgi:hypothetical protein